MGRRVASLVLLMVLALVTGGSATQESGSGPASTKSSANPCTSEAWAASVDDVQSATGQLARGEIDGTRAVWSHGDDVTLFGGYGGLVDPGWSSVGPRLE